MGFSLSKAEEYCRWNPWQQVLLLLEAKSSKASRVSGSIAIILLQSSAEESCTQSMEAEQEIVPVFLSYGNGLCGPLESPMWWENWQLWSSNFILLCVSHPVYPQWEKWLIPFFFCHGCSGAWGLIHHRHTTQADTPIMLVLEEWEKSTIVTGITAFFQLCLKTLTIIGRNSFCIGMFSFCQGESRWGEERKKWDKNH